MALFEKYFYLYGNFTLRYSDKNSWQIFVFELVVWSLLIFIGKRENQYNSLVLRCFFSLSVRKINRKIQYQLASKSPLDFCQKDLFEGRRSCLDTFDDLCHHALGVFEIYDLVIVLWQNLTVLDSIFRISSHENLLKEASVLLFGIKFIKCIVLGTKESNSYFLGRYPTNLLILTK